MQTVDDTKTSGYFEHRTDTPSELARFGIPAQHDFVTLVVRYHERSKGSLLWRFAAVVSPRPRSPSKTAIAPSSTRVVVTSPCPRRTAAWPTAEVGVRSRHASHGTRGLSAQCSAPAPLRREWSFPAAVGTTHCKDLTVTNKQRLGSSPSHCASHNGSAGVDLVGEEKANPVAGVRKPTYAVVIVSGVLLDSPGDEEDAC